MEYEEYKDRKNQLKLKFETYTKNLAVEYAKENNPCNIGDIVSDGSDIVKIEKIGTYLTEPPCFFYSGIELTKTGEPKKRQMGARVFQNSSSFRIGLK